MARPKTSPRAKVRPPSEFPSQFSMASPGASGTSRRALIVATSATRFMKTDEPTGCWLEEVAVPYMTWTNAGYQVDITTPGGAPVPWDPASQAEDKMNDTCRQFLADGVAQQICKTPVSISKVLNAGDYDIVFLAGGHGAMFDLKVNKTLAQAVGAAIAANRVIAAVCHGVCGLLNVTDPRTGNIFLAGKRVCSFTNDEEKSIGKTKAVPFLLESAVVKCGASFEKQAPWTCNVVRDGQLVTGQNPQSSAALAEECLRAVEELGTQPVTPRPK